MAAPTRKITANLPAAVLAEAQRLTGAGVTETLIQALEELRKSSLRSRLRALRGKVQIDLDLRSTRR